MNNPKPNQKLAALLAMKDPQVKDKTLTTKFSQSPTVQMFNKKRKGSM